MTFFGTDHAVGMIEMGLAGPQCWEWGWTWAGNEATSFSNSGYGPGEYVPGPNDGGSYVDRSLVHVGVSPPGTLFCENIAYREMVTGSISSIWAGVVAGIGTVTDGTCSYQQTYTGSWSVAGIRIVINMERSIRAASLTCRNYLPYDVTDTVSVKLRYAGIFINSGTVSIVRFSGGGRVPTGDDHLSFDSGAAGALAAADNRTFWAQGALLSDPIDNLYPVSADSGAYRQNLGSISDAFASAYVIEAGLY